MTNWGGTTLMSKVAEQAEADKAKEKAAKAAAEAAERASKPPRSDQPPAPAVFKFLAPELLANALDAFSSIVGEAAGGELDVTAGTDPFPGTTFRTVCLIAEDKDGVLEGMKKVLTIVVQCGACASSRPGEHQLTTLMPAKACAMLIGVKGQNIKDLVKTSGAHVHVEGEPLGFASASGPGGDKLVQIKGNYQGLENAMTRLVECVLEFQDQPWFPDWVVRTNADRAELADEQDKDRDRDDQSVGKATLAQLGLPTANSAVSLQMASSSSGDPAASMPGMGPMGMGDADTGAATDGESQEMSPEMLAMANMCSMMLPMQCMQMQMMGMMGMGSMMPMMGMPGMMPFMMPGMMGGDSTDSSMLAMMAGMTGTSAEDQKRLADSSLEGSPAKRPRIGDGSSMPGTIVSRQANGILRVQSKAAPSVPATLLMSSGDGELEPWDPVAALPESFLSDLVQSSTCLGERPGNPPDLGDGTEDAMSQRIAVQQQEIDRLRLRLTRQTQIPKPQAKPVPQSKAAMQYRRPG